MHIHILGICGTFMGGLAVIARQAGHTVTGCDAQVYPPMSTQLRAQGIDLIEGYGADQAELGADLFVVGNVVSRGNPLMEAILDRGLPYTSGPQWLAEHILADKWVLAVSGTHGKTTTTAMLTHLLVDAGMDPGFLIGGVPLDFGVSARLTQSSFFVIEADEYDTAFFDKRSKFVHYRPRTLIINNLEYDHADIFADLAAIQTQFHHLVRTVPGIGRIIANGAEAAIDAVLTKGCWSELERFEGDADARVRSAALSGSAAGVDLPALPETGADVPVWRIQSSGSGTARVTRHGAAIGELDWQLQGEHNRLNALAAVAAARHVGVPPAMALAALGRFKGVKRRMEVRGSVAGVTVYDDFAHHPTAIKTTVAGLRASMVSAAGDHAGRILAVLEPRSNTMKLGVMKAALAESLQDADQTFAFQAAGGRDGVDWDLAGALLPLGDRARVFGSLEALVQAVAHEARAGDQVLVMSNGGFGGVHQKLLDAFAHTATGRHIAH